MTQDIETYRPDFVKSGSEIMNYIEQRISKLEKSKPIDALPELHRIVAFAQGRMMPASEIEISTNLRSTPFLKRCSHLTCTAVLNLRVPLIIKQIKLPSGKSINTRTIVKICEECQTRNEFDIDTLKVDKKLIPRDPLSPILSGKRAAPEDFDAA
jgi:hypothetical protein